MRWVCITVVLLSVVQVFAWGRQKERTWHVKGKPVQATQYAVNGDKVHLYTVEDWPEPRVVFISDLSSADQEYIKAGENAEAGQGAQSPVCPMLDINVSVDVGKKTDEWQEVTLRTNVKPPGGTYREKVNMKILLVGKEAGASHYTVIDRKTYPFRLPTAEPLTLDFKFRLRKARGARAVPKYAGYLVEVSDDTGSLVALAGYPAAFKKDAGKLSAFSRGDRFDQRFQPVPEK
ncbi:hypothetical protein PDESU_03754 [Pontiella desulfatans]|uniref:SLA1 homology domain-containing protein n=1 Tax=Pontiella desulfatans TaxID=2750659 RepID=A0A6C2U533_PONDE|nr:hypothetical protein [Pontiella desulfatans]VGO15172.1 hypothetical protein PDESU_03754 [Pontiella desulfatans]